MVDKKNIQYIRSVQGEIEEPREQCYICNRAKSACICNCCNPISTKTRFIILMHPMEYRKEKNGTGRMTNLQLENSEIIVGVDFTNNMRVNEILAIHKNNSFLLYPGQNNFNLSENNQSDIYSFLGSTPHLFILDGTWPCARKMLKLSLNLQKLKRVSFDNTIQSKFIFKQQPAPLCLSTIESVYTVINILKAANLENCCTDKFLNPFKKMVEQQVHHVTNPNNVKNQIGSKGDITAKNSYKKSNQRNILFER